MEWEWLVATTTCQSASQLATTIRHYFKLVHKCTLLSVHGHRLRKPIQVCIKFSYFVNFIITDLFTKFDSSFYSSIPKRRNARDVKRLPRFRISTRCRLHAVALAGPGAVSAPARTQVSRTCTAAAPLAAAQQLARRHTQLNATTTG